MFFLFSEVVVNWLSLCYPPVMQMCNIIQGVDCMSSNIIYAGIITDTSCRLPWLCGLYIFRGQVYHVEARGSRLMAFFSHRLSSGGLCVQDWVSWLGSICIQYIQFLSSHCVYIIVPLYVCLYIVQPPNNVTYSGSQVIPNILPYNLYGKMFGITCTHCRHTIQCMCAATSPYESGTQRTFSVCDLVIFIQVYLYFHAAASRIWHAALPSHVLV